tara:strand:+ start:315 stop:575 length:261 start_codon:yes stop_codon:yes gene_type:complete
MLTTVRDSWKELQAPSNRQQANQNPNQVPVQAPSFKHQAASQSASVEYVTSHQAPSVAYHGDRIVNRGSIYSHKVLWLKERGSLAR